MKSVSKIAVISMVTAMALLLMAPITASAGDEPNFLLMNIDSDKDTVSRNNRVARRLDASIVNQISDAGFNVYDETAVTSDNFAQGRARRTDAEVIDIAKSVQRPPMDIAVFYSIYASAKALPHTTKIKVRVEGRILNVRSGQRMGNFEVTSPKEWEVEPKCTRECILGSIGDFGTILAGDLGAILVEKITAIVDGELQTVKRPDNALLTGYTMTFRNFTEDEVLEIEEYMLDFSGYKSHRPVYIGKRTAEFWYETSLKTSTLNRNMRKMLDALGLNARVQFSSTTLTVQKITLREENRDQSTFNNDW